MPLYLLHIKAISRAKGARVTRFAAYRAGERISDQRTKEAYDFSDRVDVVHKEIGYTPWATCTSTSVSVRIVRN